MIEGLLREQLKIKKLSFYDISGEWDFDVYVSGNKMIFVDKDGDVELLTIDRDTNSVKCEHLTSLSLGYDELSNDIEFESNKIIFNKEIKTTNYYILNQNDIFKIYGGILNAVNHAHYIKSYNNAGLIISSLNPDSTNPVNIIMKPSTPSLEFSIYNSLTTNQTILEITDSNVSITSNTSAKISLEGNGDTYNYSYISLRNLNDNSEWQIQYRQYSDAPKYLTFDYYDGTSWNFKMKLSTTGDLYIDGSYYTFSPELPTLKEVLNNPEIAYEEIYKIAKIPSSEGKLEHLNKEMKQFVKENAFKKDISKTSLLNARLIVYLYQENKKLKEKNEILIQEIQKLEERIQKIEKQLNGGGENS